MLFQRRAQRLWLRCVATIISETIIVHCLQVIGVAFHDGRQYDLFQYNG
jgi:hypothetical protein